MTEPRGQELINRYRWNYGIPKEATLTEEMILAHWTLEQRLTQELLESTPENRWETFERCYSTLYKELEWLNRLTGGTDTTSPAERYCHWAELIGAPPKLIYEVGSGKAAMIGYLAQLGHQCTATEITRERGAMHAVEHPNLRWTQTDGVHLEDFESPGTYDFILSDNVIEHMHPDDLILHLEGASGMHLKEYTHRELRQAVLRAGFREVALVRLPPHGSGELARVDTRWLRRICLLEALFSPFTRPILRERMTHFAKRVGIAPLVFLAATK